MADKVSFELVSPARLLLATESDMVVVPGSEGDFGVLPGHQPVISALRPGSIDVYDGERVAERIFVAGGFAEVAGDRLTVLAEHATLFKEVDRPGLAARIAQAREAVEAAEEGEPRSAAEEFLEYLEHMEEITNIP